MVTLVLTSLAFALVALALRLRNDRSARRRWDRLTRSWEPVMLDVLGGAASPEAVFERVEDGQAAEFLTFLMTYVRRLKGDEQALVRTMAAPYLPVLVPMIDGGTAESRGKAVMLMARMGMPKYADEVARALDDESPVVAMIAARSLFRPEHERHFSDVLVHLPRFAKWSRRFLSGMLAAGGPAAAPLLKRVLLDATQGPAVRAVAADALRTLNDLDAVALAAHLLERESDREVLAGCLRILGQLGQAEHVPLVRRLAAALDPVVRAAAVSALGALGGSEDAHLLAEKLDDPSFWVSLEAARGLIALGDVARIRRLAASAGPCSTLARQVLAE